MSIFVQIYVVGALRYWKLESLNCIMPLTIYVYLRSNLSGGCRKTFLFLSISTRSAFQPFKVIQGR